VAVVDRHIEVNAMAVRHALARTFTGVDPQGHAWRGTTGVGATIVTVDVEHGARGEGEVLVHAWAQVVDAGPLDARLARALTCENAELVLGRFRHRDEAIVVEHTILAGTTMDPVEVQSSVWTVGWAAASWAPRMHALLSEAVPVPPAPQTPAARLRDAADHVEMTTRRVRRYLDDRHGGFQHHPDWGFHGAFGSARVFVDVLPVLDDSTAVRASAPVLSDIDLSDGLALRAAELTSASRFGAFMHLGGRRELWFQHAILGDDLDEVELEEAIDIVAEVADGWDDRLAAEFGGKRYADLG
jgi:T3SS (YopN, CesT) and YbjN peptide-binding chaperone 1